MLVCVDGVLFSCKQLGYYDNHMMFYSRGVDQTSIEEGSRSDAALVLLPGQVRSFSHYIVTEFLITRKNNLRVVKI